MGAALAYYALFSMFPIILVILSVVGFWLGPQSNAYDQILLFAGDALPPAAFRIVQLTLVEFHQKSTGASIIGFLVLLFTASSFFNALSHAFDKIWHVRPAAQEHRHWLEIILRLIWKRILAFLLVVGSALLILLSLLTQIAIDILLAILERVSTYSDLIELDRVVLLPPLQWGASFILLIAVVMILFRVLPTTRVTWHDVGLGAVLTASLLILLQQLISNSIISLGSRFQSYGLIGGVMVLLLWIYLTSQIFFLGGEFTYVYAHIFGSRRCHQND
ncbi:ribonuclease bn [Leptolyngbya sp. Heron Island J]|nr:ribonuclease bn [Leptolyngbya sp. Heron Island J]